MIMLDDGYNQGYFDASMEKDILIRKARGKAIDDVLEIIDRLEASANELFTGEFLRGNVTGLRVARNEVLALKGGKFE